MCGEWRWGYGAFFSKVLLSRLRAHRKTKNERRKREKRDRPTLTKQAVRLHRRFVRFFFSLSFVLFLFPPAIITESNVKGDDEEFGAHLILHLL